MKARRPNCQGGAASLHLYTYYWSGFDYATGNRLIQSVGTPYQGTALGDIEPSDCSAPHHGEFAGLVRLLRREAAVVLGPLCGCVRVGVLEFTLKGQAMSLGAFVESGTPRIRQLFVPFSDLTTGTETYAAGRYLDLEPTGTGLYEVDFNRAYNPYCAYNESYDCPYPPPSNRLKVPVRAGERMPSGTAVAATEPR